MHREESGVAAGQESTAADERNKGLQLLVGELLKANQELRFANQELRFKAAQLEQRVAGAASGQQEGSKRPGLESRLDSELAV